MEKVENLKKISIAFEAGMSENAMNLKPRYSEFAFVFGIGPSGITPFEVELTDKKVGDEILLLVKKQEYHTLFEHLSPPIIDLFEGRDEIFLKTTIVAVSSPDNREMVKALADLANHGGCGGDCGCGCGG